jgi:hypothetical protein
LGGHWHGPFESGVCCHFRRDFSLSRMRANGEMPE